MPVLTLAAGTEFGKDKIVPYSYRHTYVICTAPDCVSYVSSAA